MNQNLDPRVDAYISGAPPFAQPILKHVRELVHKGCPGVQETMKWRRPFFEYRDAIICNIAAFKEHCSVGFWGVEIGTVLRQANVLQEKAMGSLGRITTLKDLPPDQSMLQWIRQAATFIESGEYTSPIAARKKVVKAELAPPEEFSAALQENEKASAVFAAFSPSCRREYVKWIAEAKRPETRLKRIHSAVEWISEGKRRS